MGILNKEKQTALILAAKNNHPECLPPLLKLVTLTDKHGFTALMYAVQSNFKACVEILAKYEIGI